MHVVFFRILKLFFITGFLLQYLGNWYRTNGPLVNFTIFNTSNKNKAGDINSPWNLLVQLGFIPLLRLLYCKNLLFTVKSVAINIPIFLLTNKQTINFIHIGRHLCCAKRQLETSLGMFATLRQKLLQLDEKFAFIFPLLRTFRLTEHSAVTVNILPWIPVPYDERQ